MQKMFNFKKIQNNSLLRHIVIGMILLSFLFVIIFFSNYGVYKRIKLNSEADDLKTEINSLNITHDSLMRRIKEAETDTFEIEKVARENYGLVKPGEKIFFIEKDTNKKEIID